MPIIECTVEEREAVRRTIEEYLSLPVNIERALSYNLQNAAARVLNGINNRNAGVDRDPLPISEERNRLLRQCQLALEAAIDKWAVTIAFEADLTDAEIAHVLVGTISSKLGDSVRGAVRTERGLRGKLERAEKVAEENGYLAIRQLDSAHRP